MSLSRYQAGSFRELLHIALPLMISSLSVMSMVFVDRLLLAHYSLAALNAAANAATFGWSFIFGWMVLTSVSEVFVAQFYGAGQVKRLGEPVWQMLWLGFFSILFFIPFSIWGGNICYANLTPQRILEKQYFQWMIFFGFSFPLYGALCGFFVGQGKTRLVTLLAVFANLVNALLDVLLIFGVKGFLDPMGVEGAAIATSIGSVVQTSILAVVFLSQNNREQFGTNRYQLQGKLLWQCVRVGLPGAIFALIEILGWAAFYDMMTLVSQRHITIAAISQSIIILLYFFAEGISKASSIIAGNLIGAKQADLISNMIRSGVKLHLLFFALLMGVFALYSDEIISLFLPKATEGEVLSLYTTLRLSLFLVALYVLFEGFRLLFSGVLTASGDTLFLLIAGSCSIWILLILPVYYFIVQKHYSIEFATSICVFYSLTLCLLYMWRYRHGKWRAVSLISSV